MMFYFPRIIFYYFLQVIIRTGVEMLFNYGFVLLYSDYFFNIMPEQHIWNGYSLASLLYSAIILQRSLPPGHPFTVICYGIRMARFMYFESYSMNHTYFLSNQKSQIDLPCNGKVSCYIDKPKSKTFVLLAMCSFSIITIIVSHYQNQPPCRIIYTLNLVRLRLGYVLEDARDIPGGIGG